MRDTLSSKRRLAVAGITTICVVAAAAPAPPRRAGQARQVAPPPRPQPIRGAARPSRTREAPQGRARPWRPRRARQHPGGGCGGERDSHLPYVWGGGHRSFTDTGYDCSGAVSYVLHAAGLLASPMPSGPMASSWGVPGKGRWITVYANASHAYMIVAGLRFDTSSGGGPVEPGSGPRWRKKKRKAGRLHRQVRTGVLGLDKNRGTPERQSRDVQAMRQRLSIAFPRRRPTLGYTYGPTGPRCNGAHSRPVTKPPKRPP